MCNCGYFYEIKVKMMINRTRIGSIRITLDAGRKYITLSLPYPI
jgi:hypothetical protein